jgi:hypothetical protein
MKIMAFVLIGLAVLVLFSGFALAGSGDENYHEHSNKYGASDAPNGNGHQPDDAMKQGQHRLRFWI